jgi:hypothetical protein
MHPDHKIFIAAIEGRQKVLLTFASKQDGGAYQVRTCAPIDYGPRANAHDKADCYHLWDYDSDEGPHILSLLPAQVISIVLTDETFDPAEFVTWDTNWHHPRDWGAYS